MAVDYALLKSVSSGDSRPVLRLYGWEKPAITVGYFQIPGDELDLDACRQDGVDVIRRITGGGAVYHEHEITYSVSLPLKSKIIFGTVLDSYKKICTPFIRALEQYAVKAEYQPINDIAVDGKKISGSAQTRREGVLLQHGTLLLDVDRRRMFRYLKVAGEKTSGNDPAERIASMRDLVGDKAAGEGFRGEIIRAIAQAFQSELNIELREGPLSDKEMETALALESRIFANPDWNGKRIPELQP